MWNLEKMTNNLELMKLYNQKKLWGQNGRYFLNLSRNANGIVKASCRNRGSGRCFFKMNKDWTVPLNWRWKDTMN